MKIFVSSLLIFFILFLGHAQDPIHKIDLLTYGGLPDGKDVNVLFNQAYIVGYSDEMRNPLWVVYRAGNFNGEREEQPVSKFERPFNFQIDRRTTAQVSSDDYIRSGFDRGHLAPNALILEQYGQMAQLETFLMSNVIPQRPALNQRIWLDLENEVRLKLSQQDQPKREVKSLYVITGPIFDSDPQTIGPEGRKIPIPSSCFKILVFKRGFSGTINAIAFRFPQEPEKKELLDFVTTVDELEEATGLDFFPELSESKQNNLESVKRDFQFNQLE